MKFDLRCLAYVYLTLPALVFLAGWMIPAVSVPACMALLYAWVRVVRQPSEDQETPSRPAAAKGSVLLAVALAVAWCLWAGQGGFFPQVWDHLFRNAVFKDLIRLDWPVVYPEKGLRLVYYVGHWLPAAAMAKTVYWATGSFETAWLCGRLALLAWTSLGVSLALLFVAEAFGQSDAKGVLVAGGLFALFSGLDVVRLVFLSESAGSGHIESAACGEFSSHTTALFWVYNQAVPAWVATLLAGRERRVENYAFCGGLLAVCAPLPLMGLAALMAADAAARFLRQKESRGEFWRKVVSPQNVLGVLAGAVPVGLYLLSNAHVAGDGTTGLALDFSGLRSWRGAGTLAVFFACDVGVLLACVWKDAKQSPVFLAAVAVLALCPFVKVGIGDDFCMRVSIPPLVVLSVVFGKAFLREAQRNSRRFVVLCVVFAMGALTPLKEFERCAAAALSHRGGMRDAEQCDSVVDLPFHLKNFTGGNDDGSFFVRRLMRR